MHALVGRKTMSVRVAKYRNGGWGGDLRGRLSNGQKYRERVKFTGSSRSGAQRWGEDRERHLLKHGPECKKSEEVPTLREFAPRFLEEHSVANRQKPSSIASKETILRIHLLP